MTQQLANLHNKVLNAQETLCAAIDSEFPVGSIVSAVLKYGKPTILTLKVVKEASRSKYYLGQLRVQNTSTGAFRWANPLSDSQNVTLIAKP